MKRFLLLAFASVLALSGIDFLAADSAENQVSAHGYYQSGYYLYSPYRSNYAHKYYRRYPHRYYNAYSAYPSRPSYPYRHQVNRRHFSRNYYTAGHHPHNHHHHGHYGAYYNHAYPYYRAYQTLSVDPTARHTYRPAGTNQTVAYNRKSY